MGNVKSNRVASRNKTEWTKNQEKTFPLINECIWEFGILALIMEVNGVFSLLFSTLWFYPSFLQMKFSFAPNLNSVSWRDIKKLKRIKNLLKTIGEDRPTPLLLSFSFLVGATPLPILLLHSQNLGQARGGTAGGGGRDPARRLLGGGGRGPRGQEDCWAAATGYLEICLLVPWKKLRWFACLIF